MEKKNNIPLEIDIPSEQNLHGLGGFLASFYQCQAEAVSNYGYMRRQKGEASELQQLLRLQILSLFAWWFQSFLFCLLLGRPSQLTRFGLGETTSYSNDQTWERVPEESLLLAPHSIQWFIIVFPVQSFFFLRGLGPRCQVLVRNSGSYCGFMLILYHTYISYDILMISLSP